MPLRQVPMFWLLKPQGGNLQKKCVFPLESLVEMAASRDGWKERMGDGCRVQVGRWVQVRNAEGEFGSRWTDGYR